VKRTHVPMILRGISRDPGSTNILLRIVMVTGVKVAIIRATIIHVVFTNSFFFFFPFETPILQKKKEKNHLPKRKFFITEATPSEGGITMATINGEFS